MSSCLLVQGDNCPTFFLFLKIMSIISYINKNINHFYAAMHRFCACSSPFISSIHMSVNPSVILLPTKKSHCLLPLSLPIVPALILLIRSMIRSCRLAAVAGMAVEDVAVEGEAVESVAVGSVAVDGVVVESVAVMLVCWAVVGA